MTFPVVLEPPPGLNSDDTTFSAAGAWETCSNIRFWLNRPQTIGSWVAAFSSTLTGVCRNVRVWTKSDGSLTMAFGTHSALQVYFAGALSDITPSGLTAGSEDSSGDAPGYGTGTYGTGLYSTPDSVYYARTWSLDVWGENLVAVPRGGTLYLWENDPTDDATVVTNAPDQITAMLVTPERQVLALGCNEETSGDFNPLCIRGCDLEDLTDWTTAAGNNVFEHILEGGGHIVSGRMIGPWVAVWTNSALHIGEFIGDASQTYRFDPVATNCGLIGPNAVWIVGQTAYWLAPDKQFRAWTPGAEPQILPCPIRKDFLDNLDEVQSAKIVATGISQFGEVWWHYPDLRDGHENSRYVAFNYLSGTWFRGSMDRSAAVDAGVAEYPVKVTPDGEVYYHERSGEVTWSIKAADYYLDESGRSLQIQGVRPDFESQSGDISMSVYVRKYPQGDAVTKGPFTLATGRGKRDFRATGSIASVEFSGTCFARFGKITFLVTPTGDR